MDEFLKEQQVLRDILLREKDLAKVKNNVGHGGDFGSNAFSSGVVSDVKLNGQVSESGAQSLSSRFSRQCT
nr:methyl-CpG-binding domain-containing protein 9-like [Ipomoea batatas]